MDPISPAELAMVAGGFHVVDSITNGARQGYQSAVGVVRDGYRGAVNWGVGAYAGTQAARALYDGKASWGAWFAQVKSVHDALDSTGKIPDAAPFSSRY
jgi:hypothetical protein